MWVPALENRRKRERLAFPKHGGEPSLLCKLTPLLSPQRIITTLTQRVVNILKVRRVWPHEVIGQRLGVQQVGGPNAVVSDSTADGQLASSFHTLRVESSLVTTAQGGCGRSLGEGPGEVLCVCPPGDLSQRVTKVPRTQDTCCPCPVPARPCALLTLLLPLWSQVLSPLVTFSGRLCPHTLAPTAQAFTVQSRRSMVLSFGTNTGDVVLCLLV